MNVCCHNSRAWLIVVDYPLYSRMAVNIYIPASATQQYTNQPKLVSLCSEFFHHNNYIHRRWFLIRFVSLTYGYFSVGTARNLMATMTNGDDSQPRLVLLSSLCMKRVFHVGNKWRRIWRYLTVIENSRLLLWLLRLLRSFDIGLHWSSDGISYCCRYCPGFGDVDE